MPDFLLLSRGALKHFPAGSDVIPPSRGETWSRGLHDHYLPQRGFMKSLFPSCHFGAPCPPNSSVPSALCSAWQSQALVREWRTEKRQFGQFCIVCAAEGMDVQLNSPKQWVTQRAFMLGFELHHGTAGCRGSRFAFLVRPIFK